MIPTLKLTIIEKSDWNIKPKIRFIPNIVNKNIERVYKTAFNTFFINLS